MRTAGVVTAAVLVLALTAVSSGADMKALFAFNGRLVEATMPRLDYRIATSVNDEGRYILISSPAEHPAGEPPFQIEIQLETVGGDADVTGYEARAIASAVDRLGLDATELPAGKLAGNVLAGRRDLQVSWNDRELRAHKGVLFCAVQQGIGIIVLLDVLQADYDAAEGICLRILESIHIE